MTDGPVRWGILATGWIAARFAEDLRLVPDAELVAVGSRSTEAAERFAATHDVPRAYGSWAEMLADDEVDVVYVATPHSGHHGAALATLGAGRAVLLEKPFTLDRATSAEVIELARRRGLFLMEAMWTRTNPAVLRAVELAADGAIGEVTSVQADFGVAGPFPPEHRMRNRALGGGALLDLGVYPITIAHLFLGAPAEIRAWARLTEEGVDANTGLVFGYDSGAVAALTCGMVGATPVTATVTGTTGRIELASPFFRPPSFTVHRAGAEPEVVAGPTKGNGYQYEAAEVQRCLRAGELESPLVPHATTLEIMGLLDDIRAQINVTYG
ncbi:MAG TPA: Gfo/Idh/MocA family oxidoreductase [Pilimelia sp.]|nr:Gfo/Idh/MocA family oxidoreductase [Pilimelia sp.]